MSHHGGPPESAGPGSGNGPYNSGYRTSSLGSQPYTAAYASVRDPDRRPGSVTAATVIAMVTSGLVALASVVFMLLVVAMSSTIEAEIRRQPGFRDIGVSTGSVMTALVVIFGIVLVWSIAGIVVAILAARRSRAGRVLLVVSASATALLSLLGITSVISALPLLAAVATIILLFVGGANEWYARTAGAPVPAYGQQPWSGQPQQPQPPYQGYPGYPGHPQEPYGGQPPHPQQPYGGQPPHPQQPYGGQPPSPQQPPGDDRPVQKPWG